MLSTPFICCSSGAATADSMVSASAPVYVPVTLICGGMISGNWAIGSARIATRPASTVTIEMTMATIGRRMKNPDMAQCPSPEATNGVACTASPSRVGAPSTTTRAPAASPSVTTQRLPTRSPTVTVRVATLLSSPTTRT